MNIIIIDPTNSIPSNYKDVMNEYHADYNKIIYMSDRIEDLQRNYIVKIQETDISPKTYLKYIKILIIEKTHNTNIILYNVPMDDIHKYYYYMNYLNYNTTIIIDNQDIDKDDPLLEQYDNIIVSNDTFSDINQLSIILAANPLEYNF